MRLPAVHSLTSGQPGTAFLIVGTLFTGWLFATGKLAGILAVIRGPGVMPAAAGAPASPAAPAAPGMLPYTPGGVGDPNATGPLGGWPGLPSGQPVSVTIAPGPRAPAGSQPVMVMYRRGSADCEATLTVAYQSAGWDYSTSVEMAKALCRNA